MPELILAAPFDKITKSIPVEGHYSINIIIIK